MPSVDFSFLPPVTKWRAEALKVLGAYVAKVGQRTATLCKAEALFNELKAFDASISYTASASSASNIPCMA